MKMEACGGHVEDLLSSLPTYDEEEEEENPNARQQKLLWDMAQVPNELFVIRRRQFFLK